MDSLQLYSNNSSSKKKRSSEESGSQLTSEQRLELLRFIDLGGSLEEAADKYGIDAEGIFEVMGSRDQMIDSHARMQARMFDTGATREDKAILALDEPLTKWVSSVKAYGLTVIGIWNN